MLHILRYTILCMFIHQATAASAQLQPDTNVEMAELAFARKAKETNTRTAFLAYLDSSGVIFNGGRVINGMRVWQRAPEEGPSLLWHPATSMMSKGQDLGFTTGPFEVRSKQDSLLGCGQYTTVWRRNSAGDWKVLADLGIGYTNSAFSKQTLSTPLLSLIPGDAADDIHAIDSIFNLTLNRDGIKAYNKKFCKNAILNKDGDQPVQSDAQIISALSPTPKDFQFIPIGWGIAISHDLAYVYGQTKNGSATENYLRIWGHTAEGWKIVLQVVKL